MGFALYRASAGSGKTYTLVKEYLKIVLKRPERFRNILAVTFTNKAAGEMKERILYSLRNIIKGENIELENELKKEIPQLKNIRGRCVEVLKNILHNFSDFAVTTIDSFMFKVINSFALELGLPLNFCVDLNHEKLYSFVIEKLFSGIGTDIYITDIILEFVLSRVAAGKSWNIENDIRKFEKQISNEKNIDWVLSLGDVKRTDFFCFIEELQKIRDLYIDTLKNLGEAGLIMITEKKLEIKKGSSAAFLKKISEMTIKDIKDLYIYKSFKENKWYSKTVSSNVKSIFDDLLVGGLFNIRDSVITYYEKNHRSVLTAISILENIYLLGIVNQIKVCVDEYKKEYNIIPITEFNIRVNKIVKNSPVPFIYSILGEKYYHYLIDEFQDTNKLQWENLFPLIENSMSYDSFNMSVGDGKQSIYRWRGGDVEIMENDIQNRFSKEQIKINSLIKNFRSRKNIVDFNNSFFRKVIECFKSEYPLLRKIYSDIIQEPVSDIGGFVSVEFISQAEDLGFFHQVFERIYEIIKDVLNRGFRYYDITVLVREKKDGEAISQKLLQYEVPVISPDSMKLTRSPLIQFLINIMKFLLNPSDKIAESSIIYFLTIYNKMENISIESVERYFLFNDKSVLLPEISEFFNRKNHLIRMPIYELIEEVIRIFKLSESLDFTSSGYLQDFLDVTLDYTLENNVDISSFLDWWEFNKEEISISSMEQKNAVKIMTIHKAKGLEFPIVIVPFADWKHKYEDKLWLRASSKISQSFMSNIHLLINYNKKVQDTYFHSDLTIEEEKVVIDNINLLYVAFTRAVENLYIISGKSNRNYDLLNKIGPEIMEESKRVKDRFTYGVPFQKEDEDRIQDVKFYKIDCLISNQWYKKISIRRKSLEFWKFDKSYRSEKVKWGLIIHRILSDIRTLDDVKKTIESYVNSGEIKTEEREVIKNKIEEIFRIDEVREWFTSDGTVFTEFPIITRGGILRPDRVIILGDKVIIVDFKTGEKENEHVSQILKYKSAVKNMGYKKIDSFIFYLKSREIIRI